MGVAALGIQKIATSILTTCGNDSVSIDVTHSRVGRGQKIIS